MGQDRGQWASRVGFVLAVAGSAIGLGNLWKFPYVTWQNRGGGFVLIYVICVTVVGLPIMMAEMLIGRRTRRNPVGAMRAAAGPRWVWVGGLGVLTGFVILGYYTVVAGWTIRYFFRCLGWSLAGYAPGASSSEAFGAFVASGGVQILLSAVFMGFTMSVIYAGVGGGIERVARQLMPVLFGILVLLLISALTMDGAGRALAFLFVPRLDALPARGVLEALGQAFFSLSLGMGAIITYGSYMGRDQSVVRSSVAVVVLDTLIAVLAAVIMFSVIFSTAGMEEQIGKSTAGMLFITLPELFYTVVPLGRLLAPLFYVLVGFAALTSTISLLEVIVAYFIDELGWSRRRATTLCGLACFLLTILCGLSLGAAGPLSNLRIFAGKSGLFVTLDHLASNWMLPVGGFFITLAAGWIMSRDATRGELIDATTPSFFRYGLWRLFIRFLAPASVAAIIAGVIGGMDFS
ncbi:MAG: sodium-dependent transporter [Acidobacteriota bacterium]